MVNEMEMLTILCPTLKLFAIIEELSYNYERTDKECEREREKVCEPHHAYETT